MKRNIMTVAVALALVFALCPQGFAASLFDDMLDAYPNRFRELYNMKHHTFAAGMGDSSILTPAGDGPAYVDYNVNGVTEITVYFYSRNGTFVAYDAAYGAYRLGVYGEGMDLSNGQAPLPQAMLCPKTGEAYTLEGGGLKWLVCDDVTGIYRFETRGGDAKPVGEALGYGLNIYYSANGAKLVRAKAQISVLHYDTSTSVVYETYTAKLPAGTKRVRVSLNEMTNLRNSRTGVQKYFANSTFGTTGLALASVSFRGDGSSLTAGEPEPIISQTEDLPLLSPSSQPPAQKPIAATPAKPGGEMPQKPQAATPATASSEAATTSKGKKPSKGKQKAPSADDESDDEEEAPRKTSKSAKTSKTKKAKVSASAEKISAEQISEEKSAATSSKREKKPAASKHTDSGGEKSKNSPQKAEKKTAASAPQSKNAETPATGEEEPPLQPASTEIAIITPPEESKGFTMGVTAYIVLAVGGLAALVLFKPKP